MIRGARDAERPGPRPTPPRRRAARTSASLIATAAMGSAISPPAWPASSAPQQRTTPSLTIAHACPAPAAIAVAPSIPAIATGVVRQSEATPSTVQLSAASSGASPRSARPQHDTVPSSCSAHVPSRASASWVTPSSATPTGVALHGTPASHVGCAVASPSCPASSLPQHSIAPDARRTQPWCAPSASSSIAPASSTGAAIASAGSSTAPAIAVCPRSPRPQQRTSPPSTTTHA
jgi:hypothetical protein